MSYIKITLETYLICAVRVWIKNKNVTCYIGNNLAPKYGVGGSPVIVLLLSVGAIYSTCPSKLFQWTFNNLITFEGHPD